MKIIHDIRFMQRCLDLASSGLGSVAPNPMVGCVIVKDGRIIGEGYHQKFGGPHAEVNAIDQVNDQQLLAESTLYVNLEPCAHFGKTPPCVDLIIRKGIKKVVVACEDPNPKVAGEGIRKLREAGVEVEVGVMEAEAQEFNRRFIKFHLKKKPFIILKWAQTKDGFIDKVRLPGDPKRPTWITDERLKPMVHKWRTEESAIMVGTNTARLDNPMLTAREWPGANPLRIVIDRKMELPPELALFDGSVPTWVLTEKSVPARDNLEYITLDFSSNILTALQNLLFERAFQSLIVEGGRQLLQSFIDDGSWDEARVFTGDKSFGVGVPGPTLLMKPSAVETFGGDTLEIFRNL